MRQKLLTRFTKKPVERLVFLIFTYLFFSLIISACVTLPPAHKPFHFQTDIPPQNEWQKVSPFITKYEFKSKSQNTSFHIVKINLDSDKVQIDFYPKSEGWQKRESLKNKGKKNTDSVTFNTTPFELKHKKQLFSKGKNAGLAIYRQNQISPPIEKYCALAFYKEKNGYICKILQSQTDLNSQKEIPYYAAGGFWVTMQQGQELEFKNYKNYRTAAGISNDGKSLYILAGKNLSYNDCSKIFLKIGIKNAMQFDGGNSTQVYINNKKLQVSPLCRKVPAWITIYSIR